MQILLVYFDSRADSQIYHFFFEKIEVDLSKNGMKSAIGMQKTSSRARLKAEINVLMLWWPLPRARGHQRTKINSRSRIRV